MPSLTDAFSTITANPDGTFTQHSSVAPQRVLHGGSWVALDATLAANGSTGISPKASFSDLVLSAGGNGPLATMTTSDGKSLALTAPFALPAPTLSGATAVYASVAPDTDLDVTVTPTGGFTTVIVVKSALAAANPALKSLKFTTSTTGLTLSANDAGALRAVDATGAAAFSADTPMMWDSSTTAPSSSPAPSPTGSGAPTRMLAQSLAAPVTVPAPVEAGTTAATSSVQGPGALAQTAAMPASVSGSTINLTPDADVLAGSGTHYPVYIDPAWKPESQAVESWTWTQSAHPSTNNSHTGTVSGVYPAVGTCGSDYAGGCSPADTERAYYQFNTTAWNGALINSAWLTVNEQSSADWSCTNTYPVSLYSTPPISGSTTWNSMSGASTTLLGTIAMGGVGNTGCTGSVAYAYNLGTALKGLLDGTTIHNTLTFGLQSGVEGNDYAFKHFSDSASLDITYDRTPYAPKNPHTANVQAGSAATGNWVTNDYCTAGTQALNSSWGWVNSTGTTMVATPWGPTQTQYAASYTMYDNSISSTTGAFVTSTGWTGTGLEAPSGALPVQYTDPVSGTVIHKDTYLKDGHAYTWQAISYDNLAPASPGSLFCHFRVDATAPTFAFGTSTDFPASGSGITPTKYAGQTGTIPFATVDALPVGYNGPALPAQASGVACIRWGWDPALSGATVQCGTSLTAGSLSVQPTHWGTNILYAQATDAAGNNSQIVSYAFYAPWNAAGPAPKFGDTTGDTIPDVLAANTDGNLYAHSLPTSSSTSPTTSLASTKAHSPGGDSWANYQTTHRGSLVGGNNVDDLLAHKSGDPVLYRYPNPGNTSADGVFDQHQTLAKPACVELSTSTTQCTGYAADWSTTLQITALGDITTTALDTNKNFLNRTGLLTEETGADGNAGLWFYPVTSDRTLGPPTLLSATGWKGLDLISSGDWHADGHPGLMARNRANGAINGYTFTVDPAETISTTDSWNTPITIGPFPALTSISASTQLGTGITAAAYPTVGSEGDLTDTTGIPDLWAASTGGVINEWTGTTSDGTSTKPVTGLTAPQVLGYTTGTANQWLLDSTANPATPGTDTAGLNPVTSGTATYGPVNDTLATSKQAAAFNGTTNYLSTSTHALDATADYTVSAWVKLNAYGGAQIALSQATTNHSAFYLGYNAAYNGWIFQQTTSQSATTTYPTATAPATTGVWTRLTGVYDHATGAMALYVNGVLAGAARNTTPVDSPTSTLTIGADTTLATPGVMSDRFNGAIADVRTYPSALTAAQIAALGTASAAAGPYSFADTTDFNGDKQPDLIAADSTGKLWLFPGTSTRGPSTATAVLLATGLTGYTFAGIADWNADGYQDLIARDPSGTLWLYPGDANHDLTTPRIAFASNWGGLVFAGVRDWNGNGKPDIIGKDATGNLFAYPSTGTGSGASATGFGSAAPIGNGWGTFTFAGITDWNSDGINDLIARDANGLLWDYPGNGNGVGGFGSPFQIDHGWTGFTFAGAADLTGDGHPDILARGANGTLWLYHGNGGAGLTTPTQLSTGW